jgi:hypothetical protein
MKRKDTEEISFVEYQPVYPLVNNKLTSLDVSNVDVCQIITHETISYTTKPKLTLTRPQ